MSRCYNLNSDGRFITEIVKDRGDVSVASFSCCDRGKTLLDYLFEVINGYESISADLSKSIDDYNEIIEKVMKYNPSDFWTIHSHSKTVGVNCSRCNAYCSESYTYSTAHFDRRGYANLESIQGTARKVKLAMPPKFFRRDTLRSRCVQSMQSFLENSPYGNIAASTGVASLRDTCEPEVAEGNKQIRILFDYLLKQRQRTISWTKGTDTLRAYTDDITHFLLYAGSALMRHATYSDHLFLLNKLISAQSPGSWGGTSLIQFPQNPAAWSPTLPDHYLQMMHVATGQGIIPTAMFSDESVVVSFSSVDAFDTFIENSGEPGVLAEDSVLADILTQLNVIPFLRYILNTTLSIAQESVKSSAPSPNLPFARSLFLKLFMFIRLSLKAVKRIGRPVSVDILLTYVFLVLSELAEVYSSSNVAAAAKLLCGQEFVERTVLCTVYTIMHTASPRVWGFLRYLPLHILSERSSWELMSVIHVIDPANLKHSADEWVALTHINDKIESKSPLGDDNADDEEDWVVVDDDDNDKKDKKDKKKKKKGDKDAKEDLDANSLLTGKLVEVANEPESLAHAVYVLGALGEKFVKTLTLACIHSMFRIVFMNAATDGVVLNGVFDALASICSKNMNYVNEVVNIFPLGFRADRAEPSVYVQLVDRIPFGYWEPTPEVTRKVATWVYGKIKSPENITGRRIMTSIQWHSIPIESSRAAAYSLVRTADYQRTTYGNNSVFSKLSGRSGFKEYCAWTATALGSLSYYSVGKVPKPLPDSGEIAEDVNAVKYNAELLLDELRKADQKKSLASVLKKKTPEELFSLFMLSPFGVDPAVWTREGPFVVKLFRALIEAPGADELKRPVLCQLIPYVFAIVEDKEALKACVIPEYNGVVQKYVEERANITSAKKLNPSELNLACHQLISPNIDVYPLDTARAFGDFWLKVATYQKKWFSDVPSVAILSVFLQSWYALKEGELPLPEYEKTISSHIGSWVTAKSISMIPLKAHSIRTDSPLPNFPYMLFETLCKHTLSNNNIIFIHIQIQFHIQNHIIYYLIDYETKHLFENKVLNGAVLVKKVKQWKTYTIRLPETCEIGVLFWQMTAYLYSMALQDKKCSSSTLKPLLKEKKRQAIVDHLQMLRSKTRSASIVEFYDALREFFWDTVQKGHTEGTPALPAGSSSSNNNGGRMLAAALSNSPLENSSCLFTSYVSRTDIAQDIRHMLANETRKTEKHPLEYARFTMEGVLSECPLNRPKSLPDLSPRNLEIGWDRSRDKVGIITGRPTGVIGIYDEMDATIKRDRSVDSTIQSNDNNYKDLVLRLYRDEERRGTASYSCTCGKYGSIDFRYTTCVFDERIASMAIDNRKNAVKYYMDISRVPQDTVSRVVLLDDTVHKLTLMYRLIAQQADAAGVAEAVVPPQISSYANNVYDNVLKGIGAGCVSVFSLTNMLKRIIYDLTCSFMYVGYESALSVLNRMLRDRNMGNIIAPFYTPWVVRSGFPRLLRRMLDTYTKGDTLHEHILKSFNLYEWARLGRPVKDKAAALVEVSSAFPRCGTDTFLCNYVVDSFGGALRVRFPELMFPALSAFIHVPNCPSARLWGTLAEQDLALVGAEQARDTLKYISGCIAKFRGNRDFHFKSWGNKFPEFVDVLTAHQVHAAGAVNNESSAKSFFTEALKVYTPCLDAVGPNSPWNREASASEVSFITPFTVGLSMLIRRLVDAAPRLGAYFVSEVWRYATETLKTLKPGNLSRGVPQPFVQDTLLNALAGVPWGVWLPPRAVFNDVIAMAGEHVNTYTKVPGFSRFVVSFGTAVSWSRTDYYSPDTLLQLHCALTRGLALYPEPVERTVYDQVYRLNTGSSDRVGWDILSTEMMKPVMDESVRLLVRAPRHIEELFKWFVIYVYIAQTCGIKIASPASCSEYCKDDGYYADVLTCDTFALFVDYFATLQQLGDKLCPGLPNGPVVAILRAYKGFFDGNAGTIESVDPAIDRLLGLYNVGINNTDIHPYVVEFLRDCPECACVLSQHLCRCVYDAKRLLPPLEDVLGCYFTKFDDWSQASRHVSLPDSTTPQSFIEEAVSNSYYLSFFAAFRLSCELERDVLGLELYRLIEKATVTPGKEREFFLFCYALIKQSCIRLSKFPTMQTLLYEGGQLEKLRGLLDTIAQGRTHQGFLGKIGLGKKSELDTVFRVCAKTLAAFIKAQFVEEDKKINIVRIVESDPFSVKENLSLYKDVSFKKYIKRLGDSYIARVSEFFFDIMSNPEYTIFSYSRLLASIAECVYQGKAYELSCFRNDIEVEIDVKSGARAITEEMFNPDNSDKSDLSAITIRNDCAHLGNLGSLGFNQRTVFEAGGTDVVISLVCSPDYQKDKRDIQVALTALWELVLVDFDIQAHAISKEVVPAILKIAKATSSAAEAAYRLLSALLSDDEVYKEIINKDIIAKAAKVKSTKVFASALARIEDEEVASLRTKEACSGVRALRCTNKKCLDKKVFFCPHCNVQQHFYVCITCTKAEGRTIQFCDVCWGMCHRQGNHEFKRIFGVGKCTCKNFTCKACAITSSAEFNHMDPALIAQWARSACQFGETTAEIFRQKNVSGKKLLSMSKSDMASIGLSDDQIVALRKSLSPYKSFFNRAASLFSRDYSYVDMLYEGECKFSFPKLYSHPSSLSEALTAAQEVLPPDVQVNAIYTHCLRILTAMKYDPERMWFINEFSLTDDEIMAVLMYTYDISAEDAESAAASNNNGCFSVQFNRLLRQYTPTMQNSLSGYMYFTIAALKKIPAYAWMGGGFGGYYEEEGAYVFRGVPDFSVLPNFEEVYAQGKEITWPSFSSVSINAEECRRLACSGGDPSLRLLFVIRVKKSARDIHCISAFSSESEVLIAPGTVFRVVSPIEWSEPDSVNRIELEEVSTKFF